MAINLGETTRLAVAFTAPSVIITGPSGLAFDPASVTLTLQTPDGVRVTFGPAGPIVRDSTGNYHYDYVVTQVGNTFATWVGVDATGNAIIVPEVVEVVPARVMPRVMTSDELDACVGPAKVDNLFDDNADSLRDSVLVSQLLRRAEDYALSYMLSGWADEATCVKVMQGDAILRMQIAWVACEYASERRGEFLASDGKGQYWAQYTRAEEYFDKISKANLASVAEATVGTNAQTGGRVQPASTSGVSRFVFAPDTNSPRGHGGF